MSPVPYQVEEIISWRLFSNEEEMTYYHHQATRLQKTKITRNIHSTVKDSPVGFKLVENKYILFDTILLSYNFVMG